MKLLLITIILYFQTGCTSNSVETDLPKWHYKLQNYNSNDFLKVNNSTIVIDLYKRINPSTVFSKDYINRLKSNNNTVLSYFSIGEAEDYRPDFKSIPKSIIGKENLSWPGNYTIKYWDKAWHSIVLKYLNQIINQGFNGVYLDIIDGFHRFSNKNLAAKQMFQLISTISKNSKAKRKDFKIFLQNGIDIIDYLSIKDKNELLMAIDGVAIEDYFFLKKKFIENPEIVKNLIFYKNKLKLSVEYTKNKLENEKYFDFCRKNDLIPLITDKELKGQFYISK
jgi:cysteinyl-tRNA synthetase